MTLTIELTAEQMLRLQERAASRGQAAEEFALDAIEERLASGPPAVHPRDQPQAKPIWEVFGEIAASIPDEEMRKIPPDASANVDHYLYGAPRR